MKTTNVFINHRHLKLTIISKWIIFSTLMKLVYMTIIVLSGICLPIKKNEIPNALKRNVLATDK